MTLVKVLKPSMALGLSKFESLPGDRNLLVEQQAIQLLLARRTPDDALDRCCCTAPGMPFDPGVHVVLGWVR
jgi:hypothetical protein